MNVMYTSLAHPSQMADNPLERSISDLNDREKSAADHLTPIFPPTNFEVPDIRFSNSVSPNADFNQSLFRSVHAYNDVLFTNPEVHIHHSMAEDSSGANPRHKSHSPVDASGMGVSGVNQMPCFPQACRSPLDSSSSDNNDDAPSSQLTNQQKTPNTGHNPAASNLTNQAADTTSVSSGSAPVSLVKRSKACKRKKRKDPKEPQKPVSAYALFFRDSQAAIKGHNPSASFGEVSKIVASMWDQLNPEHKEVYKKKTEVAKKQYLKQLAAYRASQVSQLAPEDPKKTPSSPGHRSRPDSAEDLTLAKSFHNPDLEAGLAGQILSQQKPAHLVPMSSHLLQQQQQHQRQLQHHHHHHHQLQQHHHQFSMGQATPSTESHCSSHHSHLPGPVYTYPSHVDQGRLASYPEPMGGHGGYEMSTTGENTSRAYAQCTDNGYSQHPRGHPGWETEYYNSESVIPQCRDVFTSWVGPGPCTNTFPVK